MIQSKRYVFSWKDVVELSRAEYIRAVFAQYINIMEQVEDGTRTKFNIHISSEEDNKFQTFLKGFVFRDSTLQLMT